MVYHYFARLGPAIYQGNRRLLFDNSVDPDEKSDDCKKQVSNLLQVKANFEKII